VSMGAHEVNKERGDTVNVTVTFDADTVNASGDLIDWPYQVRASLIRDGGTTAIASGATETGATSGPNIPVAVNISVPSSAVIGGTYKVSVNLYARTSDANGAPTTTWTNSGMGGAVTHGNAVKIIATTGIATVQGGNLAIVTVAQQRRAQRGRRQ